MSYATQQASIAPIPCTYAVITLDCCSRAFGVSPCAATGTACYNTYPTCKDKAHFDRTTKDYEFTSNDAPLPFQAGERPYITAVKYLATEIKDSLTVRGKCTVTLADEPDTDVGVDPYVATRSSVQGTFWKKLIARNPNYKGRRIVIYDGFYGCSKAEFVASGKRFTGALENIKFKKGGAVEIEAVDLLKSLDDVEIPAKLSLSLAIDIDSAAAQLTLTYGDDVDELAATGYIRIDDEVIAYGAVNATTRILSSLTRAQFGTTADDHGANTAVQYCKYYAPDNPFDTLQAILTDAGMAAGDIDGDAFDDEEDLGDEINVAAIISEPTKASDLYRELLDLLDLRSWVSEDLQVTVARALMNRSGRTYTTLDDDTDLTADNREVDLNPDSIITRCSIYWDFDHLGDLDSVSSFGRLDIAYDADAEGVNELNAKKEKVIKTRWIWAGIDTDEALSTFVSALAQRRVWPYRDAMPIISCETALKDSGIKTGEYAYLTTGEICDADGSDLSAEKFMVVKREKNGNRIRLKLLRICSKRICWIADDAAPDYTAASASQKEEYGYICDDDGYMADGSQPYVIW